MGQIKTGHLESDGAAINLPIGFVPSYLAVWNSAAVAGEVFKVEWFGEMGDDAEFQHKVLADNGVTGNLSLDYVSSGGNIQDYNTKTYGVRKVCTFDDTGGAQEDLITCTGHGYSNGDKVRLVASGGLPTNLNNRTNYWVIDATANTFRISLTQGGSAVNFGSDGTPTNYVFSVSEMVTVGFKGVTIAAAFR